MISCSRTSADMENMFHLSFVVISAYLGRQIQPISMDQKQSVMNSQGSIDGGLSEENTESNSDINQGPKAWHMKINNDKLPLAMYPPPNKKQGPWMHTRYYWQFKNTAKSSFGLTSISQNAEGAKSGSKDHPDSKKHSSNNLQFQDASVERLLRQATNHKSWHHPGWYDVIVLPEHECKWTLREDEVAVLSSRRPGAGKSCERNISVDANKEDAVPQYTGWIAGTVKRYIPNDPRDHPGAVVHFCVGDSDDSRRLGDDNLLRRLQSQNIWYMTSLGGLSTSLSEYNAVHAFQCFNLQMQNAILKPAPEHFRKCEERSQAMPECFFTPDFIDHLHKTFNGSQLAAIQWAARHTTSGVGGGAIKRLKYRPFTLVQGPRGTGKTHTLWGMLNVMHLVQHQEYYTGLLKKLTPESYKQASNSSFKSIFSGSVDDVLQNMDQDIFCSLPKLCSKARMLVCAPSDAAGDKLLARVLGCIFFDGELKVFILDIICVGVGSQYQAALAVSVERRTNEFLLKGCDEVMGLMHQLKALESQYFQQIFLLQRELNGAAASGRSQGSVGVDLDYLSAQDHNQDLLLHNLAAAVEERDKVMVEMSRLLILESRFRSGSSFNVKGARASLEASLVNETEIIFATLSSSSLNTLSHLAHGFDMIVIDDAAYANELALLPALALCFGRCNLVGDPQQLSAVVISKASGTLAYGRSLFERFHEACCATLLLSMQFRMHTQIRDFTSIECQGCLTESGSANLVNDIHLRNSSFPWFNLQPYAHKVQVSPPSRTFATSSQPTLQSSSSVVDVPTTSGGAPLDLSSRTADQRPHCFSCIPLASRMSPQTSGEAPENNRNPNKEPILKGPANHRVSCLLSFLLPFLLCLHITIGCLVVGLQPSSFSGGESLCDVIYFSTVATCTIGYGDFVPLTCASRALTSLYLLMARIIMVFFGMKISVWLQKFENLFSECFLLKVPWDRSPHQFYIRFLHDEDDEHRVLRDIMMKVVSTIIYSAVLIVIGIILSYKQLSVADAIYFAIVSMTTTGFGDETFKERRCLASLWLLISTCIMDRLFALLLEAWMTFRSRKDANSVLRTQLTKEELRQANVPSDNKYEVLVYMLKKMKQIGEREVRLFNSNFVELQSEET